jgi:hypothetical protein
MTCDGVEFPPTLNGFENIRIYNQTVDELLDLATTSLCRLLFARTLCVLSKFDCSC